MSSCLRLFGGVTGCAGGERSGHDEDGGGHVDDDVGNGGTGGGLGGNGGGHGGDGGGHVDDGVGNGGAGGWW